MLVFLIRNLSCYFVWMSINLDTLLISMCNPQYHNFMYMFMLEWKIQLMYDNDDTWLCTTNDRLIKILSIISYEINLVYILYSYRFWTPCFEKVWHFWSYSMFYWIIFQGSTNIGSFVWNYCYVQFLLTLDNIHMRWLFYMWNCYIYRIRPNRRPGRWRKFVLYHWCPKIVKWAIISENKVIIRKKNRHVGDNKWK